MDLKTFCTASGSPDPARITVTPTRTTSDFIDIDLSTPKSSSKVALVPPSIGTTVSLSQNSHQGSTGPTLPLTLMNTGPNTEQLHLTNPPKVNGNSSMVPSSNAPVCTMTNVNPPVQTSSDGTVTFQCRPPVDVQVGVMQNCSGAPGPGNMAGVIKGGQCLPPPSGQITVSDATSCPAITDRWTLLITESAAKQAFQEYGRSKFCYGSAPAKEMTTKELQPLNTYRYSLETFTESRTCEWIIEKYTGQHVDCTNVGSVLQPWEVPVAVPDMFKDGTQKMKVPNTSSVKACSQCKGMGKNMCLKCHGTGRIQCMWCNGTGRRMQMDMCQQCYGSGTESCRICNHSNIQNCITCGGKGQVFSYMQLTITWKNNTFLFTSEHNTEFSSDLFRTVHGEKIFTDEQLSVSPLANFPDSSITWASQNALEQHRTQFSSSCRVLRQKQSVELLPLTKVQYIWKGNQLNYFVYGKESKVYVQNYPQKCCCIII